MEVSPYEYKETCRGGFWKRGYSFSKLNLNLSLSKLSQKSILLSKCFSRYGNKSPLCTQSGATFSEDHKKAAATQFTTRVSSHISRCAVGEFFLCLSFFFLLHSLRFQGHTESSCSALPFWLVDSWRPIPRKWIKHAVWGAFRPTNYLAHWKICKDTACRLCFRKSNHTIPDSVLCPLLSQPLESTLRHSL